MNPRTWDSSLESPEFSAVAAAVNKPGNGYADLNGDSKTVRLTEYGALADSLAAASC